MRLLQLMLLLMSFNSFSFDVYKTINVRLLKLDGIEYTNAKLEATFGTLEQYEVFYNRAIEFGANVKPISELEKSQFFQNSVITLNSINSVLEFEIIHDVAAVIREYELPNYELPNFDKEIEVTSVDDYKSSMIIYSSDAALIAASENGMWNMDILGTWFNEDYKPSHVEVNVMSARSLSLDNVTCKRRRRVRQ